MEILLIIGLLIVFAIGPFVAMLDVLTRELLRDDGPAVDASRVLKALFVLFMPLAWIAYFAFFRRRTPFS